MFKIIPGVIAPFQELIHEAGTACDVNLSKDLESYLVFLLARFISNPHQIQNSIALEFLENIQKWSKTQQDNLQIIGDKCLLLSGLFPGRAKRKRVRISYYVKLGQTAYGSLSHLKEKATGLLFEQLSMQFVLLMDVLQSIRELKKGFLILDPLEAHELWEDTKSEHALKTLKQSIQPDRFLHLPPNARAN